MKKIVEDWVRYASGEKMSRRFDPWVHFHGMFGENLTNEELRTVCEFFPHTIELVRRLEIVLSSGTSDRSLYTLPKHRLPSQRLIELAKEHILEMERIYNLGSDESFQPLISASEFSLAPIEDVDREHGNNTNQDFRILSLRVFDKALWEESDIIYAFDEALYSIAADFFLKSYILAPLCSFPVNFDTYLEFWKNGGKFAITEDGRVLVTYAYSKGHPFYLPPPSIHES